MSAKPSPSLAVYEVCSNEASTPAKKNLNINIDIMHTYNSLIHIGTDPDQKPVNADNKPLIGIDIQVLFSSPHSTNPGSQLYTTVEPSVVIVKLATPLLGVSGSPQLTPKGIIQKVCHTCFIENQDNLQNY